MGCFPGWQLFAPKKEVSPPFLNPISLSPSPSLLGKEVVSGKKKRVERREREKGRRRGGGREKKRERRRERERRALMI